MATTDQQSKIPKPAGCSQKCLCIPWLYWNCGGKPNGRQTGRRRTEGGCHSVMILRYRKKPPRWLAGEPRSCVLRDRSRNKYVHDCEFWKFSKQLRGSRVQECVMRQASDRECPHLGVPQGGGFSQATVPEAEEREIALAQGQEICPRCLPCCFLRNGLIAQANPAHDFLFLHLSQPLGPLVSFRSAQCRHRSDGHNPVRTFRRSCAC